MKAIPPLNPLHVFAVVVRTGSFTKAAKELRVSQSAVSRQIAVLEGYLKLSLFSRDRSGISLTIQGQQYAEDLSDVFDRISYATARLAEGTKAAPLRVRVYTTFAAKWLIRRLPRFYAIHPNIEVRILNAVAPVDFARDNVDLAIQLGHGQWPGTDSVYLFSDLMQPVCSPKLLRGRKLKDIDRIGDFQLLHAHYRRDDWHDWLDGIGRADLHSDRGMTFSSSLLAYEAAQEGMGIAMGQIHLLDHELASGSLVKLFEQGIERQQGYYALWPKNQPPDHKMRAYLNWLQREVAQQLNAPATAAANELTASA